MIKERRKDGKDSKRNIGRLGVGAEDDSGKWE
jgi:hypothetical protein